MSSTAYFKEVATKWDTMRKGFFSDNVREKAYKVAGVKKGDVAADLGAGTGFITEGLAQRGVKVVAVDVVPEMLDVLTKNIDSPDLVETRVGESENLPLTDSSVDFAFANMYLHHVESPLVAIREMHRILKKDGLVVLTDLDAHTFEFLKTEHNDRWMGFDREDIKLWFGEAGFTDIKVDCVGETCDSTSACSGQAASISVFIASARKQ
ncbi:MAG: methyltransferase domain-containing protein [Ketobacter sp.]|nr:methyltransferase domain-containing protein [Planctomycetota bacterium]MCP5015804.1 methyltransferase domain-containing protein [Ketobacter sp.]